MVIFFMSSNVISPEECIFIQGANRVKSKMAAMPSKQYFMWLLLFLRDDVAKNPGPAVPPTKKGSLVCGLCKQVVSWRLRNMCCVDCNHWYHMSCQSSDKTASLSTLN